MPLLVEDCAPIERLAIFGIGGMGRELADIAQRVQQCGEGTTEIVFVSDEGPPSVLGIPVIRPTELTARDGLAIGIGDPSLRLKIANRFPDSPAVSVFSPSSIIAGSAKIAAGATICDFTVINNSAIIGRNFQANVFSQVSHDCVIGDFVTLSPRVSCNGSVHIGNGVFVGSGAIIRNGCSSTPLFIGDGAVIGMGSVVTKDVAPGALVYGNPARPAR